MIKLRDFFYFNRSDRGVLLFFLVLAVVATALVCYMDEPDNSRPATAADTLQASPSGSTSARSGRSWHYAQPAARPAERFPFDPNTADSTMLLRLGLQPWQVRNIYKYRAAGGIYRRPSDFARLYGLTRKQYRELEPYIHIGEDYAPAATLFAAERPEAPDTLRRYPVKLRPTEHIDLNTADTTLLRRVPGIGSYFASRIVNYRRRLGGFYSVEQLREIEDFPEEALKYFELSNNIRKINVNTLRLDELKRHPYLNFYQAKAIVDYRRLRGPLRSLDELRLVRDFTPADFARLAHYVEY